MDRIGLVSRITEAAINIDTGRKGFAVRGKEQKRRILYEYGITKAQSAFGEAQVADDPQTLVLVEYTFIFQELQLCDEADTDAFSSLTQAKQSFDDAFLALQVAENIAGYKEADKLFPHHKKYRVNGFPKDAFHIACMAHKTRLQNILRSPVDPIEKTLLKQRIANLSTAQNGYITKQKKALAICGGV